MSKKDCILNGQTVLGIELGSTRIKAVLTDEHNEPIASGSYGWENHYENGIWTYPLEEAILGLQGCYQDLVKEVKEKYGVSITTLKAFGVSGMMHGYLPFDTEGNLLTPFRTWRNSITGEQIESGKLYEDAPFRILWRVKGRNEHSSEGRRREVGENLRTWWTVQDKRCRAGRSCSST